MPFDAALTAWATLGLTALAVIAAIFGFLAWRAQGRQIEALRGQLAELAKLNRMQLPVMEDLGAELKASLRQREREEQERRESSVSRIFIWQESRLGTTQAQVAGGAVPGQMSQVTARNAGEVPAYDVGFAWWINDSLVNWDKLTVPLMPGADAARSWPMTPGIDPETISVAAFVRDVSGNRWRILPDGRHDPYQDAMLPPRTW